ncbi:MAG: flagellar biosynthesis anti-sigma factor FlgM [Thermoguttaceae bacterium]
MDINSINNVNGLRGVQNVKFNETAKPAVSAETENTQIQDEIEISTTARRLSATSEASSVAESGEIRYDLVNRIREEIANGTYDTPERFDVAMEHLLSRLG